MTRGPFITLEGLDGSGKTSQVPRIAEWLRARGLVPLVVREPGGTPVGEALRSLVLEDPRGKGMAPLAEALLMLAARAELVERVIRPALAYGHAVVCDRFADSTIAYQGHGLGLDVRWLEAANRCVCGEAWPDLTLLFDVPPAEARRRAAAVDRIGGRDAAFAERVRQGYLAVAAAEPQRVRVIDATCPSAEVWTQVEAALDAFWAAWSRREGGGAQ